MSTTSQNISHLNDLITTLKDGQAGFKAAAEDVDSADIRAFFNTLVLQRSKFAGEVQSLVQSLGESNPESDGSISGAVHRGWIDLKAALTSHDEHAILAECERGEDAAVAHYREILDRNDLPGNVREVLTTQFADVQAAHDRVRDLRDTLAAK